MAQEGAGGATPLRLKDLLELDCDSCSAAGFRCYPRRLGESSPSLSSSLRHCVHHASSTNNWALIQLARLLPPASAMKRGSGSSSGSEADDKQEQLSPVAVMDFPDDDDDDCNGDAGGSACSPSFSLARLQRRKMLRPQHKIRRFGSTDELGPVDLEALLAATSDADDPADDNSAQQVIQCRTEISAAAPHVRHDPDEHGLLELLLHAAGADHVSHRLLLDFLVEMKQRRRGPKEHPEELSAPAGLLLPRKAGRLGQGDDGEVLAAARGWLDGAGSGRWGLNDVLRCGEAVVAEMDRGRRWMQVGEEEKEVGAVVAGMLADQLVDEVVWDLLV